SRTSPEPAGSTAAARSRRTGTSIPRCSTPSPRSRPPSPPGSDVLSGGRAHRGLVDRVPREAVELGGEQVAAGERRAGRRGNGVAVDLDARQGGRVAARERDLPAQTRAEPPREQQRVRARPFDRHPLGPADPGPALGERRPPREPTPPGEIGDDDPVEEAGERLVRAGDAAPLVRIDDEAVADVDDLVERLTVPVGAPAP